MKNVFIIGSKSLGNYGGYETFVDKLTEYHKNNNDIQYFVFCKKNGEGAMSYDKLDKNQIIDDNKFVYNNAKCYRISVPQIGPAQAIYYDCASLNKAISIIKENKINDFIIYILACRIGIFIKHYTNIVHRLGGKIYVNPDGHEWKRSKWGFLTRKYWKFSEKLMVKNADLVICDSKNIEKYIHEEYGDIKTTFIPYGAEIKKSILSDDNPQFVNWLNNNDLKINEYYLVVGRFVPENNYETIIREFINSDTKKKLAIITNENQKFYNYLEKKYHFTKDNRIKFISTVYNQELLKKIRECAYAYIHGHSVGGTNPSLLEALASTKLNLLYDCIFNREVANDSAIYWGLNKYNLKKIIEKIEKFEKDEILTIYKNAIDIIKTRYNWNLISEMYCNLFF